LRLIPGKEVYTANAAAYVEELREPDAPAMRTAPAIFAPYFAESYNLKAEFLVDIPEENPAPEDVKRIMDTFSPLT